VSTPLSANDQAVKALAGKLWAEMLASSPIWGPFLGIEVNDGALDDNSDAARLRDRAMWEKYGAAAAAIGDDGLDAVTVQCRAVELCISVTMSAVASPRSTATLRGGRWPA